MEASAPLRAIRSRLFLSRDESCIQSDMKALDRARALYADGMYTYGGEIFVAAEICGLSTMSGVMGCTDRISSSSSSSISSSMTWRVMKTSSYVKFYRYGVGKMNYAGNQGTKKASRVSET